MYLVTVSIYVPRAAALHYEDITPEAAADILSTWLGYAHDAHTVGGILDSGHGNGSLYMDNGTNIQITA